MTQVKICGLSDPDMVSLAARHGADWIGFMLVEGSPRQVTLAAVETLLLKVGKALPVAVLVDPTVDEVMSVAGLGFPVIQLHGRETPLRVAEIKAMTGCEVWKALGVATAEDLERAGDYDAADRLLIDAKPPAGAVSGGHGAAFDWGLLKGWTPPKPWLLAGGLTPGTVAGAIRETGAAAVDVSSGVERQRGLKDKELVRAFLQAAKGNQP